MTKQTQLDWNDVENLVQELCRQMQIQGWKPDYVVGITRGGLIPATLISHYLDIPMHSLKVSLRDGSDDSESNLWMAEEAFGVVPDNPQTWDPYFRKKILVVDDINDTGATFQWIQNDWQSGCFPQKTDVWKTVWNNTVKFAVLINNETSAFKTQDFSSRNINKLEDPQWIIFPWEEWWLH